MEKLISISKSNLNYTFFIKSRKGACGFSGDTVVKNSPANAGDTRHAGSIPGLGRCPGGGNATHSSILAQRIPWTEEPGGLQSIGSQRVRPDLATEHTYKGVYILPLTPKLSIIKEL